jgi:hypothetical protein
MRKITSESKKALESGKYYKNTNTEVMGGKLFLFGNLIARKDQDGLEITNAGWFSATTRERLNALEGVHIQQKAGIWFLNGVQWDGRWIKINTKDIK